MSQLFAQFGYCTIPKNTLLFRGHKNADFNDCMFFSTKKWVAGCFNDSIQVYKSIKDIQVLFLIDEINSNTWSSSALPKLYNKLFPHEKRFGFNDLDIKHSNINRRNKLIQKLFEEHEISGWFTSLEKKVELEICLFDKQANTNQLKLIDIVDSNSNNYLKDSLDRIKILPSEIFYKNTSQKLLNSSNILLEDKDHYKSYQKKMNSWIKQEVQNGMGMLEAKHYLFDLRTKLKI